MNSNPEVLLKKRKNADRLRIEKQEAARKRQEEQSRKRRRNGDKFIRAERLISQNLASERENYRIKRIAKNESEKPKEAIEEKPRLLFVVRVAGPHGAKIPSKARKVLSLLRLAHHNRGVFVRWTATIAPLLRLVSPYVVVGTPSLATVRSLIQKRAKVTVKDAETNEVKQISLNDNNLVEDKLGERDVVCIEDMIHEIVTMGENFKHVIAFLDAFELAPPVSGWGPLNKLKRIDLQNEKEQRRVSNSGNAPVTEVDIDRFISEQN